MWKSKHMQMSLEFLSKYWTTCINFGQLLDEGFSPKISSTLSLIFVILSRERSTLGFSCSSDSETFIIWRIETFTIVKVVMKMIIKKVLP